MRSSESTGPNRFPLAPLAALLFLGFFFFCLRPIEDHDVWWHLASGRYMVAHHLVPHFDVFSWTCAGRPWIDNYWLYQLLIYGLYALGSGSALILYKGAMAGLVFWPVYLRLRRRKLSDLWILAGTGLAFWGSRLSQSGWGERASLISLMAFSWLLWDLENVPLKRPMDKRLWIWPLIFVLWANLQPGFALGLLVVGIISLDQCVSYQRNRWLSWAFLCCLATLATPYGIQTYRMLWTGLTHPAGIAEWLSPSWPHMAFYWGILAGFWLLLAARWVRRRQRPLDPGWFVIALLLSQSSAQHVLYVPFFVVLAVPWLVEWMPAMWTLPARQRVRVAFLLLSAFAVSSAAGIRGGIDESKFPVNACRFIDQSRIAGPFLNSYSFGGYWIWHFFGRRPVFIDGRYPTVAGYVELKQALRRAQGGSPGDWQAFLDRWQVNAVLLDTPGFRDTVYAAYFPAARWKQVYGDSTALIYVRQTNPVKPAASSTASRGHAR